MVKNKGRLSQNAAEENENLLRNQQNEELSSSMEELRADIDELDKRLAEKIDNLSTGEDLAELRRDVEKMNINKELKEKFIGLIQKIEELSKNERNDLIKEILTDREDPVPHVPDEIFPTHALAFVRTLESSPLGQNLIKDATGLVVGATDSAAALVKLGWALIKDVFLLPRDIISMIKK